LKGSDDGGNKKKRKIKMGIRVEKKKEKYQNLNGIMSE